MVTERPNIDPKKYYRPEEGAGLLGVNVNTLLRWSRTPGLGLTRYTHKKTHLLCFKGCDLLSLWDVEI